MTNPYQPDNILAMHAIPTSSQRDLTVVTVFKDGTMPHVFAGYGENAATALDLIEDFQSSVRTRTIIENELGHYTVIAPEWTESLEKGIVAQSKEEFRLRRALAQTNFFPDNCDFGFDPAQFEVGELTIADDDFAFDPDTFAVAGIVAADDLEGYL